MKTILLSVILIAPCSLFGQGWTAQTSGTTTPFNSVFFSNPSTGWAVGGGGAIRHTTDGGVTWIRQTSGTPNELNSVFFSNSSTGWAVGAYGTILHTTDGGANWTGQASGTTLFLWSVYFIDDNTGWIAKDGSSILKTTDAGATWTFHTAASQNNLFSIYFVDAMRGWTAGWLPLQGRAIVLNTVDGGITWTEQLSDPGNVFISAQFADAASGWVVGGLGSIFNTTDGGTSWTAQTSGTLNQLGSVFFIDASTGWAVGWSGTILHTTNGGTSWTAQSSGTTERLECVYFTDANTGWAVGRGGTILHYSSGGIPCDEIDLFKAKCDVGGAARAMVRLLNSTEYAGETVEFQLDGTVYPVELISNGTHTIGRLEVPQAGYGQHTITLVNPAGCYDPITVNCRVVGEVADSEFDAAWAEFDALYGESALTRLVPQETRLIGNYPNPFNPSTTIRYGLPQQSHVMLEVFNMLGQRVAVLVDEGQDAGYHEVTFEGATLASGLYFYRLRSGDFVETRKLVLLR